MDCLCSSLSQKPLKEEKMIKDTLRAFFRLPLVKYIWNFYKQSNYSKKEYEFEKSYKELYFIINY